MDFLLLSVLLSPYVVRTLVMEVLVLSALFLPLAAEAYEKEVVEQTLFLSMADEQLVTKALLIWL